VSDNVTAYGIREQSPATDVLDTHAEELRLVGYTIIESGIADTEISRLSEKVEEVIARQEVEFGGRAAMAQIGDEMTGRALLAYDETFLSLATNQRLLGLVERMLGQYFVLSQQNSIVLAPGENHGQARYHRDLPYQHFTSSRPLAVNALFCVDAFTAENGATRVIPASHKYEPFPSEAVIQRQERIAAAPKGSFIVLDAMLFHRGGRNSSTALRRGINHVFVLPFMRQQVDLPTMLGGRYADDPKLRKFLGYECQTPDTVLDWRRERASKMPRRES
jgi:ectoine hydroxylase-related dioxygenase (phytanoyl-CoA dioxygenase family)